jgi:hypothetical protein
MSSGTQLEMDWMASDAGQGDAAAAHTAVSASAATNGATHTAYLTDEEILELDPIDSGTASKTFVIPSAARNLSGGFADTAENQGEILRRPPRRTPQNDNSLEEAARDTDHESRFTNHDSPSAKAQGERSTNQESQVPAAMPAWMAAAAADPQHGAEAAELWREHQEFRAAFSSPEEARAVRELLPGGVRDAVSLREATQSVERIDAALFSGDARAQAEVVAELARANPAAFRALFAEAAKFLAGNSGTDFSLSSGDPDRGNGALQADASKTAQAEARATKPDATSHQSQVTSHSFDPAAYAAFERSTNEAVARDVRSAIGDTLQRVLPEGVADGAARRIGEDIFQEIHRALAADRALSEQVAAVLQSRRFGSGEQQRVASLLAGRAKQLVPSVARRVISEWTSSVLNTSRAKAARQAIAASRVDIAAPGGSRDSMPLRQMNRREVDYASMSDEDILGL